MAEGRVQRRLAAILAADVVGYSRMMGADETGTLERLNALRRELLHPKVEEYGGRIVKTTGDGTLIEFPSAVDAVQHAVDVQQALAHRNGSLPNGERVELRIGINLGDVIVEKDDIFGEGVNVAARLEGIAEPGSVCISATVFDQVRGKVDLPFEDLGDQSLKNIAEPVHAYAVALGVPGAASTDVAPAEAMFRRPAVAVLPFENLSGDPDQEYFAEGLTEDLITALSLWRTFPVIARNSTFAYKGTSPDIRRVGEELGARYVIEGSVRKSGNRVRVTAQLINAETGHHVWAERFDRDLADIFELQDELTQRIAATVSPEVERVEARLSVQTNSRNLDAWDLVQRGMAHLGDFDAEGNAKARTYFEKALELEPRYADAFIGIVWSHIRDLNTFGVEDPEARKRLARSAALRAVELDRSNPYAHLVLGIACTLTGELPRAIEEFELVLQFNPNSANGYVSLGHALALSGRGEEAIGHLEKGLALNPKDPRNHLYFSFMARAQLTARHYEEAVDWARRAIQWNADSPLARKLLVSSLAHSGRIAEAQSELEMIDRVVPGYMANPGNWHAYHSVEEREHFRDGLRKAGWEG